MCGEGVGCVGLAGTVPAAGSEGACVHLLGGRQPVGGDGGGGVIMKVFSIRLAAVTDPWGTLGAHVVASKGLILSILSRAACASEGV